MTVEAVLEHGVVAKVANGRLTVEGNEEFALEPVDVALSNVEEFHYERSPAADYPGALVLKTKDGEEVLLRLYPDDAPAFVTELRAQPAPSAEPQFADSTDNDN